MCSTSLTVRVSLFRHRIMVWILLTILSCSFLPFISMAQQPTATRTLNGTGQEQKNSKTSESTENLSGRWEFTGGSCNATGCTGAIPCPVGDPNPECCGIGFCDCCVVGDPGLFWVVTQKGNKLTGNAPNSPFDQDLNGTIDGKSVSFTITEFSMPAPDTITSFVGSLDGNTINGTLSGQKVVSKDNIRWEGTFTVTIKPGKESSQ